MPRREVLLNESHDRLACLFRKSNAVGMNRKNRPVALQADAEGLAQAIHRIGREHAGTRTGARTGAPFEFGQLGLVMVPGGNLADTFEYGDQIDRPGL